MSKRYRRKSRSNQIEDCCDSVVKTELNDTITRVVQSKRRGSTGSIVLSGEHGGQQSSGDFSGGHGRRNSLLTKQMSGTLLDASNVSSTSVVECFAALKELHIIDSTKAQRKLHTGRSISSIRKNPYRRGGDAAAVRNLTILTKNIVIGGRDETSDAALLHEFGISHILNVAHQLPNFHGDKFIYLHIPLHDTPETSVVDIMEQAAKFISHVEGLDGRVLVHCVSGVSRSVAVVVMYLIMRHRIPLRDAYNYLKSCRPFIRPNDGFKLQMTQFEIKVLGGSSVARGAGSDWSFFTWNRMKHTVPVIPSQSGEACCITS